MFAQYIRQSKIDLIVAKEKWNKMQKEKNVSKENNDLDEIEDQDEDQDKQIRQFKKIKRQKSKNTSIPPHVTAKAVKAGIKRYIHIN